MNAPYQIEPELRNLPPRCVYPNASTKSLRFLTVFLLPFLLAGLAVACLTVSEIFLEVFGQQTTGQVIRRVDNTDPTSEGKSYSVAYTFRGGQTDHQVEYEITEAEYQATSQGQTVPVKYLALGPKVYSIALLPGRNPMPNYAFLAVFTLGWNGVVFGILYMAYILPKIRRSLYREGEATVGKITNKRVDEGEGTLYTLFYEFTLDPLVSSQTIGGRVQVSKAEYEAANIGDELTILYNPHKPRFNVSYRHGGYGVA